MTSKQKPQNTSDFLKSGSTDSSDVAAYYDDWAETYDATLSDWSYQAPAEAAERLSKTVKDGGRILDVGCGTGGFGKAMAGYAGFRVAGMDISEASLEIAAKLGCYDQLQQVDLQATPLPPATNSFDGAACVGVMTYMEKPADLLGDLCRIVKPGGHILFTQRDDRWAAKNMDDLISRFDAEKLWTPIEIGAPKLYLPGNEDYSDKIRVIQVLCRVG